jgi:hypothetical protein
MISRRHMLASGLASLACLAAPCGCFAAATRTSFGCIIADDEADALMPAWSGPAQTSYDGVKFVSSGNRDLDYALAQTLSRITDLFGVLPGFAYFDDFGGANAFATQRQFFSRADGTVLFGRRMLDKCLAAREAPDAVISGVCAHEFGHIAQFKLGLIPKLTAGQPTAKRKELHADFLSGYFAGVRKREKPDFPAAVYATSAYSVGDYSDDSKRHHGTPEERAGAVVRGYEVAFRDRRSFADAVQIGMNYVMTL